MRIGRHRKRIRIPSDKVLTADILIGALEKLDTPTIRRAITCLIDELDSRDSDCDLESDCDFEEEFYFPRVAFDRPIQASSASIRRRNNRNEREAGESAGHCKVGVLSPA